MAGLDDPYAPADPYAPPPLLPTAPLAPAPWELAAAALPPPPVLDAVQPGIGIPSGMIDAGVAPEPAAYAQPLPPPPFDDGLAGAPVDPYASYPPPPPPDGFGAAITPDLAPPALAPALAPAPPTPLALPAPVDPYAPAPIDPYAAQPPLIGPPLPPSPPPALDLTAADPFAGLTEAQGFAAARKLALTDPEALLQLEALQTSRKAIAQATRQHQIEEEQLQQIRDNAEARRIADEKTRADEEHINAAAAELGKQRLDRGRWFRNASTLQQIGAVVGTLVGGLMSRPGQPNQGVKFLADIIDNDINDQKYDIENQRADLTFRSGAVAREYQRTGDLHRSTEAVRLATYNALIGQLQTDMQNFDSRGTAFREFGKQVAGLEARKAAQRQADGILRFDQHEKTERLRLEAQRVEDARIAHRDTIGLARAKESREAAAAKAEKQVWSPGELAFINPGQPKPPISMSQADYTKWLTTQKVGSEAVAAARANDPDEINIQKAVPGIVDDTGKLVHFADKEKAGEVSEAKENVDEMVRLSSNLIRSIRKNGWSSDFIKSKEWRTAQQDFNEILIKKKEKDKLGVLTGPDVGIVTKEIGTSDPTEARGEQVIAALEHFQQNQIEGFNTKIRNKAVVPAGRTVSRWEPPKLSNVPETTSTPEEVRDQALLQKPARGGFAKEFSDELFKRRAALSPDEARAFGPHLALEDIQRAGFDLGRTRSSRNTLGQPRIDLPLTPQQQQVFREVAARFDPSISKDQRARVQELGAIARGSTPDATSARADLARFAESASEGGLADLARDALNQAIFATIPSLPGEPEQVR